MKSTAAIQTGKTPEVLKTVQKVLLICGILSSLIYIGADAIASFQWEGYSYANQAVSELMCVGSPARPFLVVFFTVSNVLSVAFGMGLWSWARDNRKRGLSVTGILQFGYGIASEVSLVFFPMYLSGNEGLKGLMHLIAAGTMVLFLLSSIGFGAFTHGKLFRFYSIGTILISLLFGAWSGFDGARFAAGLATPGMGIRERINIFTPLVWLLVLAISLLWAKKGPDPVQQ